MAKSETQYSLAEKLKEYGYAVVTDPYSMACDGYTVFMLVPSLNDVGLAQRSFYERLVNDKIRVASVRNGRILFASGGSLRFIHPDVLFEDLTGRDKTKTFHFIYRG